MKRPTDEDLILFYYGESPTPESIERALERSPELTRRFADLERLLDTIEAPEVPELETDYGARVWSAVEARLERRRRWLPDLSQGVVRRWSLVGAAAALALVAFLAGRMSSQLNGIDSQPVAEWAADRDRALLMEVTDHLDRSQVLLLELVNSDDEAEPDLTRQRRLAADLKMDSRLYRRAAAKAGRQDVADLLESMEIFLVELANAPQELDSPRLQSIRRRIEEGDLLFRVRIVGSRLRQDYDQTRPSAGSDDPVVDV